MSHTPYGHQPDWPYDRRLAAQVEAADNAEADALARVHRHGQAVITAEGALGAATLGLQAASSEVRIGAVVFASRPADGDARTRLLHRLGQLRDAETLWLGKEIAANKARQEQHIALCGLLGVCWQSLDELVNDDDRASGVCADCRAADEADGPF